MKAYTITIEYSSKPSEWTWLAAITAHRYQDGTEVCADNIEELMREAAKWIETH